MSGVNSEVVKRKRIALNYTQEKLAEKAELSRSQIQRIEKENINCGIETVKKYDLQGQVDREFANEKESGRYDIISECKNSQRFLENIKNELKNKEEKIKKEECSKWDKIHEDKKPLHKECFFVQMELKEEYCNLYLHIL